MAPRQNQISVNPAWPSTLFLAEWPDHQQRAGAIADYIRAEAAGYSKPVASGVATSAKPARGLTESPLDLFEHTGSEDLAMLAKWCANMVRGAVANVNGDGVAMSRMQVTFTESWFHITNQGGFHDAHTHGACSWCGIFYLDAGNADEVPQDGANVAGNGINRFYSPISAGGIVRDYGNAYLGRSYLDIQPTNGRLVIFPSYLLHSALPYTGDKDRIIISFNSRTTLAPA
ncbi:MAG: putative 2OG-Fe(II) oxygenase [Pseudomonadota bacterium]